MRRSAESRAAKRKAKVSLALPSEHLTQVRSMVEAGEFASAGAVVREALRAWLHRRTLHAGRLGAERLSAARRDFTHVEPSERVELLFDAGDAKA